MKTLQLPMRGWLFCVPFRYLFVIILCMICVQTDVDVSHGQCNQGRLLAGKVLLSTTRVRVHTSCTS